MSPSRNPDLSTASVPEDITGRPRRVVTGGISLRNTFSALRHRNFRLFFYGQLISLIGTWMTTTAQGWLVYQLTGSKALLGVVAAAGSAPMLIFSTWGGWAADRYPKRSVLVVTQICFDDPVARHGGARLERTREAMADHRARDHLAG